MNKHTPLIPYESQCKNRYLHKFITVFEHPQGVLELCERCKKKNFIRVIDGRVDNVKYIKYHNREVLPPNHPLFLREYAK